MNLRNDRPELVPLAFGRAALALALLACGLRAQLGAPVAGPIDVQSTTGNSNLTGVNYATGGYVLSGGAIATGGAKQHYEVTFSGVVRQFYDSCPSTAPDDSNSDWAYDEQSQCYLSARSNRLCCYRKQDGAIVCVADMALGHPASAVCRDQSTGRYFTADGLSEIREFTFDPLTQSATVVRTIPSFGKDIRGLAWDPASARIWAACANSPAPGQIEFVQVHPLTGLPTGVSFAGLTLPGVNLPGGCDIYHDVRNPGKLSLVALHRSQFDSLVVYDLAVPYPCSGYPELYCTAKTNSLGCVPTIQFTGVPSASAGIGFTVRATQVVNQKTGLLFYSLNGRNGALFQGGRLCVAPPTKRTPQVNSNGAPLPTNNCSGLYVLDMNRFAVGALGGSPDPALTVAGAVVCCQWWGRDPLSAPFNTTLSAGLEYVICP